MTSIPAAICTVTISNAIISKTKDFFLIVYCISEMWMNFQKNDEYPSLIISELIDARGYLNV